MIEAMFNIDFVCMIFKATRTRENKTNKTPTYKRITSDISKYVHFTFPGGSHVNRVCTHYYPRVR